MRFPPLFLILVLLLPAMGEFPLKAQSSPVAVSLPAQLIHGFSIPSGGSTMADTFWVCESSSLHLSILLPVDGCNLILTSPSGATYSWDPIATAFNCFKNVVQPNPANPPFGYVYHFQMPSPMNGKWALDVVTGVPVTAVWNGLMNVDFVSNLGAGLFSTKQKLVLGAPVAVSLGVMDGSTPLTTYQYTAQLSRVGDPASSAQSVSFQPLTNPTTGNTTQVAQITPTQTGTYYLQVVLTGSTPQGTYERLASTTFSVHPPYATLSGPFTQRVEISFPSVKK